MVPCNSSSLLLQTQKHHCSNGFESSGFEPFIKDGFVIDSDSASPIPVDVMHDTGASTSILLQAVLPLSEKTCFSGDALTRGCEMSRLRAALHNV